MKDKRSEIVTNILTELAKLENFEDVIQTVDTAIVCACMNQEDVAPNQVKWLQLVISHLELYIQKIQKGEI